MVLKRGLCLLLLIVTFELLSKQSDALKIYQPDKSIAKKLMEKCQKKGYKMPQKTFLKSIFINSTKPTVGDDDQAEMLVSSVLRILNQVNEGKNPHSTGQLPMDSSTEMNCKRLSAIMKRIRNSESSACYVRAVMASMFKQVSECKEIDTNDYETLLSDVEPFMKERPSKKINLPSEIDSKKFKPLIKLLTKLFNTTSDDEKSYIAKWAKEQILQNKFNCTMKPRSDPSSRAMARCKPSLKWLDFEEFHSMDVFISTLEPNDIDSSPPEKFCEFISSERFASMKPFRFHTMCKKFLKRSEECFSKEMFAQRLDKLSPLTCCLGEFPRVDPSTAKKLLGKVENCSNPVKKLKKRLVDFMSNSSIGKAVQDMGKNSAFMSLKQFKRLLALSFKSLKEILKNETFQWKLGQQCMLVKRLVEKCKKMSAEELQDLPSLTRGLSVCSFKLFKADELLKNTEILKNIFHKMTGAQTKVFLKKLGPTIIKDKWADALLSSTSLSTLRKVNFTDLDQLDSKKLNRPQAAYLAKKFIKMKLRDLQLHGVLGGVTCEMINTTTDYEDLIQTLKGDLQMLSQRQMGCLSAKVFVKLRKQRDDYFKTITEEELNNIPTNALPFLPPDEVKVLPDSVCSVFLEKMEMANLTKLPLLSPSRPALTQRALQCLTNGNDLSELTVTDVYQLGQLVCELSPATLLLLNPEVRNSTLTKMAVLCRHFPELSRKKLPQLIKKIYGDQLECRPEMWEKIGPLLLLDDDTISALPNNPCLKDVLYFWKLRMPRASLALKRKFFEVAMNAFNATGIDRNETWRNSSQTTVVELTEEMIDEVGSSGSHFWSAKQLNATSNDTFLATVETLGKCSSYTADQLAVLAKKATEAFGRVTQMTDCQVLQLGCICQGFSNSDLEKMPFSLDSLKEIDHCGWNESQMRSVWRGIAERDNLKLEELEATDLVSMNRFMCGLSISEILQLNMNEFMEAVGSLRDIKCLMDKMERFKGVAVLSFGHPKTWDEAQTSELCEIICGLNSTELASLKPSVMDYICSSAISKIPPKRFRAFSPEQLRSLGSDNAAMVTRAQRDVLSEEQQAALKEAATGAWSRSQRSEAEESGAPSLSVEGISAFMTPFLFLCMGFVLL